VNNLEDFSLKKIVKKVNSLRDLQLSTPVIRRHATYKK